jgi:nickel transport protein
MQSKHKYILILALTFGFSYAQKGLAHGSHIKYESTDAIEIKATYDSGEPMANAQVTVYNPKDIANPWLKGLTNEKGEFVFIPDYSITGNWEVKVRQAGHGNIINIPIKPITTTEIKDEEKPNNNSGKMENSKEIKLSSSNNAEYTIQQKLIMAAMGIWGFVGTALYFSRKKVEQ